MEWVSEDAEVLGWTVCGGGGGGLVVVLACDLAWLGWPHHHPPYTSCCNQQAYSPQLNKHP